MRLRLASLSDTYLLAALTAKAIRPGSTLGLSGPLGAGKTAFVRALVKALGGKEESVCSPSYVLQHEYPLGNAYGFEHWDLYRVHTIPEQLLEPPEGNTFRVVEWPERASGFSKELNYLISIMPPDYNIGDRYEADRRIVVLDDTLSVLVSAQIDSDWRMG